eukprot:g8881.t1
MDGLYLEKLLCHYRALKRKVSTIPLVLCIQENVIFDSSLSETKTACDLNSAADVISHALSYACDKDSDTDWKNDGIDSVVHQPQHFQSATSTDTRLSTIYDSSLLKLIDRKTMYLPKLGRLSILNRLAGFRIEEKTALVTKFKLRDNLAIPETQIQDQGEAKHASSCPSSKKVLDAKKTFTVVNFHLDAAGNNEHRTTQFQKLADDFDGDEPFVLCGDTNLFTFFPRSKQQLLLDNMIEPLSSKNGAVVIGDYNKPTHFFSRANEPKLGHQIVYQLGKIGLDVPGCYDVLISNMSEESFGQIDTPDSDHNLVYANLRL